MRCCITLALTIMAVILTVYVYLGAVVTYCIADFSSTALNVKVIFSFAAA